MTTATKGEVMSENFVSILGGRYITNGHVVKNASPYSLNPNPIAQVVVGGQVGYHLKFNKKRVFYSVDLIKAMYQQEAELPQRRKCTLLLSP
jgi:hypothetical protein